MPPPTTTLSKRGGLVLAKMRRRAQRRRVDHGRARIPLVAPRPWRSRRTRTPLRAASPRSAGFRRRQRREQRGRQRDGRIELRPQHQLARPIGDGISPASTRNPIGPWPFVAPRRPRSAGSNHRWASAAPTAARCASKPAPIPIDITASMVTPDVDAVDHAVRSTTTAESTDDGLRASRTGRR